MFGKKENPQSDYTLVSIYDSKAGKYRKPVIVDEVYDLVREYERMCIDPQAQKDSLILNSEDFQVFKIGQFSKTTGEITSQKPEHVFSLHEIKSALESKYDAKQQASAFARKAELHNPVGVDPT